MSERDTIRAFLAVELPASVRKVIARLQRQLQRELPHSDQLRWVNPDIAHITLKFLGEVPVAEIGRVSERVEAIARQHTAFPTALGSLGVFPHIRRPRVVWVEATDEHGAFRRLARDIETAMSALGFQPEKSKRYIPHITLARTRQHIRRQQQAEIGNTIGDLDIVATVEWRVDTITFIRSVLTPQGPQYTPLSTHHLREADENA
nr:RNA 2',3'-cyclic phosphodiesterase [Ardenticatena sp.]